MATVQPCLRPGGKRYKAVFLLLLFFFVVFLKKEEKINYTSDESVIKP